MLKRQVLIGDTVYTCHVISTIHVTPSGRMVYVNSYISESDIDDKAKSPVCRAYLMECETSQDFADAQEFISGLQDFAEYKDALDEILSILTDEQAEQVIDAFPLWETDKHYEVGVRVRDDGNLYRCLMTHTSQADWQPHTTPALWVKVGEPGEIPEWVQPTGAHDAYNEGDKVKHNGSVWVSEINANTYEPGVYGWAVE